LRTLLLITISENKYFALLLLLGKFLTVDRQFSNLTAIASLRRSPFGHSCMFGPEGIPFG